MTPTIQIQSIIPNSHGPGQYTVKLCVASKVHEFRFEVHDEQIRYVTGDDAFRAVFDRDPMTAREIYRAVLSAHERRPAAYPIAI